MPISPPKSIRVCLRLCLLALLAVPAQAVILLTGDNSANTTEPDLARRAIFNSVARVCDGTGGLVNGYGSAVRLRGKYLLTARHVNTNPNGGSHVTFDGGATLYQRDTAFPPVTFGTTDLKLIKLVKDPGLDNPELGEVNLFSASEGDIPRFFRGSTVYATATIVAAGVGRNPANPDGSTTWDWGSNSTLDKRWGINRIEGVISSLNYPLNGVDYDYPAIYTTLEASSGDHEAAMTRYDSGCGLFIEDNGEWKLAGIATAVQTAGSSTFSDSAGDQNYFVRINQLAATIEAAIPDPTTYSGWKVDHSLYGANANDDADTDGDGIPQLLEYALGGNPNNPSREILPVQQMTEDGGSLYLELSVTRPVGLQGLSYLPQTDTTLTSWPADSTGIADPTPTPTDNGDGTETLIYRRSEALSANPRAFMRLKVQSN